MDSVDVDLVDVVALTRALSDIDSTTGRETETGQLLAAILRDRGYDVQEQPVGGGRFNVFATLGQSPQVVFSTHYDCVPPFFPTPSRERRCCSGAACATPRAFWRRRWRPPSGCG